MYLKPKVKAPQPELIENTLNILKTYNTNTICIESACPNISECFNRGVATFLILGKICTRNCKFCNVSTNKPLEVDENEPVNIAKAIKKLNLNYVVITSVDRDDLKDFGSNQFIKTVKEIKKISPNTKIELLTPDFRAREDILEQITQLEVEKFAHNIEIVPRLYKEIMPQCNYEKSLKVLKYYSKKTSKSSIMVGVGESIDELKQVFNDLAEIGVKYLTIGQYLRPTPKHYPVKKYYSDEEFEYLKELAIKSGIKYVISGKLVRSSYYADKY